MRIGWKSCFVAGCLFSVCGLPAQSVPRVGGKAWTVKDIFQNGGPLGTPPRVLIWSPNGENVTYVSEDNQHGQPNDLIQVNAGSGNASVLAPESKMGAIYTAPNDEQDRDHRGRYSMPSYHWSPDGKQLLFDNTGVIWRYDLARKDMVKLASTGMGSGDDPQFSPDGKTVSYVKDHNLHLIALSDRHESTLTTSTSSEILNGEVDWAYEEELDVRSNYFWSPDSQHIAYLQTDESRVPKYPITDWNPIHSTVYEEWYSQAGDPNPGVRVGIVGANGGATTWLKLPFSQYNDYIPRFGWLDNRYIWIQVVRRDQKHLELYFADTQTGKIRKVYAESDPKFLDWSYDMYFLHDGQLLLTSWRDGYIHMYLYRFDAKNPLSGEATLERQLTHGDWAVLGIAGIDEKKGIVYYISNESDFRQQMLWEIHLDGTGKKMLSTIHGVHRISFSPDHSHYVDTYSNLTTPPLAKMCDLSGSCKTFWRSGPLNGHVIVQPIMFTGKASDGSTLYGQLFLPPGMKAKAAVPLIVNPYGGPSLHSIQDEFGGLTGAQSYLFDQLLVQHGFAVLHADNRGMGGQGKAFAQFAYHNFGPIQLRDQLTMVDTVLAKYPQLDGKRMGWWGWSWGGYFTLYAMTHSDRFVAGVSVAPVTDWRLYDSIYTERYMGLPSENEKLYHDDSDLTSAAHLHGNLLLVHGTGDDNVHMQNSIQMIQRFVDANVPYRLLLYPRKTHLILGQEARTHLFDAILDQFETHLKHSPAKQ